MPAQTFTDVVVEAIPARPKRYEVPDAIQSGLYLQVLPSGSKTWALRQRQHGKTVKVGLGSFPCVDVSTARERAQAASRDLRNGHNPNNDKRAKRLAEKEAAELAREELRKKAAELVARETTIKIAAEQWLKDDQAENRTHHEVERIFGRVILPRWGSKPIGSITKDDCRALMADLKATGHRRMPSRVFTLTRRFFQWLMEEDKLQHNPMAAIRKKPKKSECFVTTRDRVLTDDEVIAFWGATDKLGYPFGTSLKLLLLTAARKSEIGALEWSELSDGAIHLPASRVKNGRPHEIPLSPMALSLINSVPKISERFVFSTNGQSPISGWSKSMNELRKLTNDTSTNNPTWWIHDLRRTAASGMQRLGVAPQVIEGVLNHTKGGVQAVYQRHNYLPERARALNLWTEHVNKLIGNAPAQVLDMQGRKVV